MTAGQGQPKGQYGAGMSQILRGMLYNFPLPPGYGRGKSDIIRIAGLPVRIGIIDSSVNNAKIAVKGEI